MSQIVSAGFRDQRMIAAPDKAIARELGVAHTFDVIVEVCRRIDFLKAYLRASARHCYVLGVSGGIDSLSAGLLAQRATQELRRAGYEATLVAVRLPYGRQADEDDAEAAMRVIAADREMTIDIKPATDAMATALSAAGLAFIDAPQEDFVRGNIKARQRMIAQYALAGTLNGLVIGTDHAAEAVMGFFTKFGDGAADVLPLAGLTKRRVRAIAAAMGAPAALVAKVPTADLEDSAPLRPDEDAFGVSYQEIDRFLEGEPINEQAAQRILGSYSATRHKRALPASPLDTAILA